MKTNIPILMYHSIAAEASPIFRRWTVAPALFEQHMAWLRTAGYTPLTVTRMVRALDGAEPSLPARPVVVTFDDGFADFHAAAVPILSRYACPATLYVCTGYLDGTSRWLERAGEGNRPMLTWDQVAELPRYGVEVGAHTHTHPQLDTLPPEEAREEIVRSRQLLEDWLGVSVESFAYPHGYHSRTVREMVRQAGFSSACAVKHAMSFSGDDRFALARIIVLSDTTIESLGAMVEGRTVSRAGSWQRARSLGWRVVRRTRRRLLASAGRSRRGS
ncbi:MAG TPA: polysaccharide deacetylase family protein [Chloroflexota bacterium]|nr:polysaccharide deacetylase family protein [Chloroflexota bacterium]